MMQTFRPLANNPVNRALASAAAALCLGVSLAPGALVGAEPEGGALDGQRPRVIVSTDVGGSDPDDFQSMVHYLVCADLFDTEGLISSPPKQGRAKHILECIAAYEKDYPGLRSRSAGYPEPAALRAVVKQGATDAAPKAGHGKPSEGSRWIIERAHAKDAGDRPLWVLVWGSITDVAQAVHDDPSIKERIRVYFISSWNRKMDPFARDYLFENHKDLWWIECDTTFRGMYVGGAREAARGDLSNTGFVEKHVRAHGALGGLFWEKKRDIKMGDTPSVLYLMRGNPDDPASPHWGGRFQQPDEDRRRYWTDIRDKNLAEGGKHGAKTVNRWREAYLRDWQRRMEGL